MRAREGGDDRGERTRIQGRPSIPTAGVAYYRGGSTFPELLPLDKGWVTQHISIQKGDTAVVMDMRCRIEVLGPLRVIREGGADVVTRFPSQKAASLLALLAFGLGRAHGRESLLEVFWPQLDEAAGRDNLSTLLSSLRRLLEPPGVPRGGIIVADRQSVSLNPAAVATDAADFEARTREAARERDPAARARAYGSAVALWRGEPLPGFYDEWVVREQSLWAERRAETLENWAAALEQSGEYPTALEAVEQALAADPLREEGHRRKMRLLASLGRPDAAHEAYRRAEALFREEMDAPPSAETRRLAEAIQNDTFRPRTELTPPLATDESKRSPAAIAATAEQAPQPPTVSNLPLTLTRFFGREEERATLAGWLTDPDGPRLVTLLGPGGVGKTRLAVEAARVVAADPAYAGRTCFVGAADLPVAGLLPSALARALGVAGGGEESGGGDPLERAVELLNGSGGPSLVVLDNLEHLLAAPASAAKGDRPAAGPAVIAFVRLLRERCDSGGLRLLITSRRTLNLTGEQMLPVAPLPAPAAGVAADPVILLRDSPAVALYVDRARAAKPDFALSSTNAADVAEVCRRLEGVPLAIELAASWARVLPPAKVRERLGRHLDLLVTRRTDLPPRHRSLRAAVEWSYDLLEPELRRLFARLAVFRGGETLEAVEAVCEEPDALQLLARLEEQSLIRVIETEDPAAEPRWRMLEPLREFAAEKLAESGEEGAVRRRHGAHFATEFQQRRPHLFGADAPVQRAWCEAENDNLRTALDWACTADGVLAVRLAQSAGRFWQTSGRYAEGRAWCARALAHPDGRGPTLEHVRALCVSAYLAADQSDYEISLRFSEEAVALCRAGGAAAADLAATIGNLGCGYLQVKDLDRAWAAFGESVTLAEVQGDSAMISTALINMSLVGLERCDWAAARDLARRARDLSDGPNAEHHRIYASKVLGYALAGLKDPDGAADAWADALTRAIRLKFGLQIAMLIDGFARLAWEAREQPRAARLFGAADALYGRLGSPRITQVDAVRLAYDAAVANRIGSPEQTAAWEEGATWDEQTAAAFALGSDPETAPVK